MGTLQCGKPASVFGPSCPIFVSPEISGVSCELVLQAVVIIRVSISSWFINWSGYMRLYIIVGTCFTEEQSCCDIQPQTLTHFCVESFINLMLLIFNYVN